MTDNFYIITLKDMVELKIFYKKMDYLLTKIGKELSNGDYLFSIAKEIEHTFGNDLHLSHARIYEKSIDEFILVSSGFEIEEINPNSRIPLKAATIQFVLTYPIYIFDNPAHGSHIRINHPHEETIPVAFSVESHHNQWIFVFELRSGWIREEIEFCLNLVKTLLNYRLFSESVQNELEQAVKIQKSLLPTSIPQIPGFQIAGYSQPAVLVGGDFFDYCMNNEKSIVFYVGDASGHGIPAALMARDAVIGLRMGLENQMKMKIILQKLNLVIHRSVYSTGFVSLFFAKMNMHGDIYYVNAGHPSGLIIHKNKVIKLESTGLILGALPEISLEQAHAKLEPSDLLILYSDGILERTNKIGEFFDSHRLEQLLLKINYKSVNEILEEIFLAADEFGEGLKWDDDATIMAIKRNK